MGGHEQSVFYFTTFESFAYKSQGIEDEANMKYDLTDNHYKEKTFEVKYRIDSDINEDNEEFDGYIIVGLELVEKFNYISICKESSKYEKSTLPSCAAL